LRSTDAILSSIERVCDSQRKFSNVNKKIFESPPEYFATGPCTLARRGMAYLGQLNVAKIQGFIRRVRALRSVVLQVGSLQATILRALERAVDVICGHDVGCRRCAWCRSNRCVYPRPPRRTEFHAARAPRTVSRAPRIPFKPVLCPTPQTPAPSPRVHVNESMLVMNVRRRRLLAEPKVERSMLYS
jgi:hypothetical protein